MNKHENEQIITSIYMQGEETYIEKWHTAINTFAACIVLYITKKEVFTKTNTHCRLSIFFFSSHLKRSNNILFWEEWVGDINSSVF